MRHHEAYIRLCIYICLTRFDVNRKRAVPLPTTCLTNWLGERIQRPPLALSGTLETPAAGDRSLRER
jgi:hypothetical protein